MSRRDQIRRLRAAGAGGLPPVFIMPPSWAPASEGPISEADITWTNVPGHRQPTKADLAAEVARREAERQERLAVAKAGRIRRLAYIRGRMAGLNVCQSERQLWLADGLIDDHGRVLRDDGSGYDPVFQAAPPGRPEPPSPSDSASPTGT